MNILKKAFTLVELLISITIITVLGVIAFMSFFNNVSDTRDTIRIEDMSSIEKVLETHNAQTGEYPNVTNPGKVTFTGDTVLTAWEQGTFGETTQRITDKLFKTPVDPLTKKEYIYSLTDDKQEYQIAGIFERKNVIAYNPIKQANANKTEKARLKIMGKYNGKVLKIKQTKKIYILAVPSIIHGRIGDIQLMEILENRDLLYSGHFNLPQIYSDTKYELKPEDLILVNPDKVLVYSGAEEELTITENQITFIEELRDAYDGTSIENEDGIIELVKSEENEEFIAQTIIQNNILSDYEVEAINNGLYNDPIITCGDKSPGDTFKVDGVTYTVIDNDMLSDKRGSNDTHFYETACTTLVTSMFYAFYNSTINPDLSHWDTSNVVYMNYMFYNASGFNQPLNFDTSNVTNMNNMFYGASSFNQPINFDTSNVNYMDYMFYNASSFNQSVNFDTSNVKEMNYMFKGASSFNQPVNFDTSNVTVMTAMFYNASSFNQPLNFDTSNVTMMNYMFYNAGLFDQNISGWNVSNVTNHDNFDLNTSSSWTADEKPTFP